MLLGTSRYRGCRANRYERQGIGFCTERSQWVWCAYAKRTRIQLEDGCSNDRTDDEELDEAVPKSIRLKRMRMKGRKRPERAKGRTTEGRGMNDVGTGDGLAPAKRLPRGIHRAARCCTPGAHDRSSSGFLMCVWQF